MSEITPQRETSIAPMNLQPAIEAAAALGKDGVEVIERLHALQMEQRRDDAKAAFVSAMANLRAEMPPIIKSVSGQHGVKRDGTRTRGLYAPLDTITPILDPIAAKHGLTYRFDREVIPGRDHDYMVCIVTHRLGHEERTKYPCPVGDTNRGTNSLQAIAVGESYAKRYSLLGAFGITTADPDSDGNYSPSGPATADEALTDEQALNVEALLEQSGADYARFLSFFGVEKISQIPASRYGECVAMLRAKVKKAKQ